MCPSLQPRHRSPATNAGARPSSVAALQKQHLGEGVKSAGAKEVDDAANGQGAGGRFHVSSGIRKVAQSADGIFAKRRVLRQSSPLPIMAGEQTNDIYIRREFIRAKYTKVFTGVGDLYILYIDD